MTGPEKEFSFAFSREQNEQASKWLARQERGLSEAEQQAFEGWLSEDPGNEACFFEHQVAWASLEVMDEWKPTYSRTPNPDLFEARQIRKWRSFLALGGLAAAVLFGFFVLQFTSRNTDDMEKVVVTAYESRSNEKHFLEDGSSFYLLPDSEVRVAFSEAERTIEFVTGEAEFTVAHDSDRPFVVHSEVGRVTALGTIFSVRQDANSWEVFVTEGKVKVDERGGEISATPDNDFFSAELVAGQKMFEELSDQDFSPEIEDVTDDELRERSAWKDQIIDMVSAPLEEILREFSHFNSRTVFIYGEELKQMRMTVAIKRDNLQDFIDLLEVSAGVKATETPSGSILLTRPSQ